MFSTNLINKTLVLFLSLILFSCGDIASEKNPDKSDEEESTSTVTLDHPRTDKVTIKSLDDALEILTLHVKDKNKVELKYDGNVLIGKTKDGIKRKFKTESGDEILQSKSKDPNKIKIKSANGQMLWKIKIKDDKIQITNQEKGDYPIQLKKKGDKIKVYLNEKEIGFAKLKGDKVKINKGGKDVFSIKTSKNSYAFAIMTIDEIASEEKYVIMAELFARGL